MPGCVSLESTVELMHALADGTRVRLLALLAAEELTVAELTQITALAQSRISTHLAKLRDVGLLRDRRAGASNYYALNSTMPEHARELWSRVEAGLSDAVIEADERRLRDLLRAREGEGPWLEAVAGEMERHYSPGRTWETTARGLLGFAQLGDVLDLCSGDGVLAELVAPHARSIVCLDRSEQMVKAAQRRLGHLDHVRAQQGDMHELPFGDDSFDQLIFFNALTYSHTPARVISEMARVLRPGGNLALMCLHCHSHGAITAQYQHVVPGYAVDELQHLLTDNGFVVRQCRICCRERKKPYFEVISAFAVPRKGEKQP
jgi:ubiquinone/menaquinone biosynthesis C-methylase UbiE/DNA-binding transcriptional ArsR family regulator